RSGSRNFTTSSWTQVAGGSLVNGPHTATAHCALMSLYLCSTPPHPKNCWMPSGATPLQKVMRLTVPIGWSSSRIGPDLCLRPTDKKPNVQDPDVMDETS